MPQGPLHLSLRPDSASVEAAAPISVIARIDHDEYISFPNSSFGVISIAQGTLERSQDYVIRVMALAMDGSSDFIIEFEGIWLDRGGFLQQCDGSSNTASSSSTHDHVVPPIRPHPDQRLDHESEQVTPNAKIGMNGRTIFSRPHRKTLEIVTDRPSFIRHAQKKGLDVLERMTGWEQLLGNLFSIDHVNIVVDGLHLIHTDDLGDGIGRASDIFFRRSITSQAI